MGMYFQELILDADSCCILLIARSVGVLLHRPAFCVIARTSDTYPAFWDRESEVKFPPDQNLEMLAKAVFLKFCRSGHYHVRWSCSSIAEMLRG
jgi:pseudouridine-5'-phosphate glycosidase